MELDLFISRPKHYCHWLFRPKQKTVSNGSFPTSAFLIKGGKERILPFYFIFLLKPLNNNDLENRKGLLFFTNVFYVMEDQMNI